MSEWVRWLQPISPMAVEICITFFNWPFYIQTAPKIKIIPRTKKCRLTHWAPNLSRIVLVITGKWEVKEDMIPVLEESRDYYITPLKPEKNNEILNRSLTLRIKKSMPRGSYTGTSLGKKPGLDWKKEERAEKIIRYLAWICMSEV